MSVVALEHVLVLADDIEGTREFYCSVLGLSVGSRPPLEFPGYWLYAGEGAGKSGTGGRIARVLFAPDFLKGIRRRCRWIAAAFSAEFPGAACVHVADRRAYAAHAAGLGLSVPERDPGVGPIDHVAFSARDWETVVGRLERAGVGAVQNTVPGGPRQLFFDDPNGVRVEINVPDHETNQAR